MIRKILFARIYLISVLNLHLLAKRLLWSISVLLILNGCQTNNVRSGQLDRIDTLPDQQPMATSISTSNNSLAEGTPSPQPLIVDGFEVPSNLKNHPILIEQCVVEVPQDVILQSEDAILIGIIEGDKDFTLGKLASDFQWEIIPNTQGILPIGFSPDSKWFAFTMRRDGRSDLLRLIDAEGNLKEIEMFGRIDTTSRWFNNNYLILEPIEKTEPNRLLNPFTNETKPFPDFPKEKVDERFSNVYWFDPYGASVLYLETEEGFRSFYSSEQYVVFNTITGEKVETGLNWVTSRPAWSPSGNYLSVVSLGRTHVMRNIPSQEIFLVDVMTGDNYQISNFFELFNGVSINQLTWSPDGRYLLFELDLIDNSLPESYEPSLYLFDFQTKEVVDLCLNAVTESKYHWSPNGRIVGWHDNSEGDLYLLDITTGNLFHQSSPQAGLIGWLSEN